MSSYFKMVVSLIRGVAPALALCVAAALDANAQTLDIPAPVRAVVYRDAPFVIHETFLSAWPVGGSDHMMRVDFDGTTFGPGKAARASDPTFPADRTATVYYSAVESGFSSDQGYFFLGYYWYHPKDNGYSFLDPIGRGHEGPGHEHDIEGAIFLVKKSAYLPFGTIISALTQAHGEMIPYLNPYQTALPNVGANGSPAYGVIEHWDDLRYGAQRSVTVVRGRNHGTHMPQKCINGVQGNMDLAFRLRLPDMGYGMELGTGGTYTACVHDGYNWMLYRPMMEEALAPSTGLPGADVVPIDATTGLYTYQLLELSKSPFWTERQSSGTLFSGNLLTGAGGFAGYESLFSYTDPGEANPPWQWVGGGGCRREIGGNYCWYSFGTDGTGAWNNPTYWPVSPTYGRLLTDPAAEFGMRFYGLPQLDQPYRYNPYSSTPPSYNGPEPMRGTINGPGWLSLGEYGTWTAAISGGVPPFQYQWSGVLSGSDQSVSGPVDSGGDLYLDVWDAAGQHLMLSTYISNTGCSGMVDLC